MSYFNGQRIEDEFPDHKAASTDTGRSALPEYKESIIDQIRFWTVLYEKAQTESKDNWVKEVFSNTRLTTAPTLTDEQAAREYADKFDESVYTNDDIENAFLAGRLSREEDAVDIDGMFKWAKENYYHFDGKSFQENTGHDDFETYTLNEFYELYKTSKKCNG